MEQTTSDGTIWQTSAAQYPMGGVQDAEKDVLVLPDMVQGVRGVALVEPMGDEHWAVVTFSLNRALSGDISAVRWRIGDRMVTLPVEIGQEGDIPGVPEVPEPPEAEKEVKEVKEDDE